MRSRLVTLGAIALACWADLASAQGMANNPQDAVSDHPYYFGERTRPDGMAQYRVPGDYAAKLNEAFDKLDADGSHHVTKEEWVAGGRKESLFRLYDISHDGLLTPREFQIGEDRY